MHDLTFDILRSAVTLARNEQIDKVGVLRARLEEIFPQWNAEIDAALKLWAEYAAEKREPTRSHV